MCIMVYTTSLNLLNSLLKSALSLPPFYKGGNWDTGRFSVLLWSSSLCRVEMDVKKELLLPITVPTL